jgi:hypothetical protein
MFKKHKCQGCGSTDFIYIPDTVNLTCHYNELVFDVISTAHIMTSQDNSAASIQEADSKLKVAIDLNENNRYYEPVTPIQVPDDHVRGPSFSFSPTFRSPSFHDDTRSSFDSHHGHSSYHHDSSPSHDSFSSDSSSSFDSGSCDCGSCGGD